MACDTHESAARERILENLRSDPGQGPSEIADAFGIHPSTARYHLRRLVRQGALTRERVGRQLHYYPTGAGWCTTARCVHARLTPATRATLEIALSQGVVARRSVVSSGHTRSACRWAFKRLVSAGILERLEWGIYAIDPAHAACIQAALRATPCTACNEAGDQRRYPTSSPSPRGRIDVSRSG